MDLHSEIPSGEYCYEVLEVVKDPDGGPPKIKTKVCPHWERTENGARCNLLNEEHFEQCCFHLVWDQVKECGINLDRDYEPVKTTDEERRQEGFELKDVVCRCDKKVRVWHKGKDII